MMEDLVFECNAMFFISQKAQEWYKENAFKYLMGLVSYDEATIFNYQLGYLYDVMRYDEPLNHDFFNSFWGMYHMAFDNGVDVFEAEYSLPKEVIYGGNVSAFVEDLYRHFMVESNNLSNKPWNSWAFSISFGKKGVYSSSIRKYGYYAGLIKGALKLQARYPSIFKNHQLNLLDKAKQHIPMDNEMMRQYEEYKKPEAERLRDALKRIIPQAFDRSTSTNTPKTINQLIANNQLQEAIEATIVLAQEYPNIDNEAIALSSRYRKNEEGQRKGIISLEDYRLERNRITDSLQKYLNELPEKE